MTDTMENEGKTNKKGCSWWGIRVFGVLLILLLGLIVCGFLYQSIAMGQDLKQYPPPGELIDVGGHKLHIYCLGTGSPTVILEAGLGDNWLTWGLVQEKIAGFTPVCAYDRAGLGWSDAAQEPLNDSQVVESLHTLLNNADIQGPYILVGHSLGGFYVRSFAHQYPEEVAGIVLVDSYHENQFFRIPPELAQSQRESYSGMTQTLALVHSLAPFGVVRIFGLAESFAQDNPLPPEDRQMLIATYNRTNFSQAVRYEYETAILNIQKTRPLHKLGDIPLVALAKSGESSAINPEDLPTGVTKEMLEEADKINMELQQELADLSTNGTLVVVEDTGHYIQFDQPDAVIDAVRKMVESLRE